LIPTRVAVIPGDGTQLTVVVAARRRGTIALPIGDYAVLDGDRLVAAVERRTFEDLVQSLIDGKLGGIWVAVPAPTGPRPDFAAHQRAARAPFRDVAQKLRELLGARLADIGGVAETRAVREWADGTRTPENDVQQRCRVALHVATESHLAPRDSTARVAPTRERDLWPPR
jgi:hypothetical protein